MHSPGLIHRLRAMTGRSHWWLPLLFYVVLATQTTAEAHVHFEPAPVDCELCLQGADQPVIQAVVSTPVLPAALPAVVSMLPGTARQPVSGFSIRGPPTTF